MRELDPGIRRWRTVLIASGVVVALTVAPGAAVAAPPAPGTPVCRVADERLDEISGLVATDDGFVAVNDGSDEESHRRIFFLDADCAVVRTVRFPSRPRDTEDLAVTADGTVWVADIGDNDRARETVAVWTLRPGIRRPALHRMAYPDGPHDAEALLVTGDGRPLIVTKQVGAAGLYAPATPLRTGATVPLSRVGAVRLPDSSTSNPFGFFGRRLVTGAASAPDRRRVVLRSYADAFEFDVPGGDVIAALTTGRPRVVALPDEPQGESVTYSRDGRFLLTVSETADQPSGTRPTVLRYPLPSAPAAAATRPAPPASAAGPGTRTGAVPAPASRRESGAAAVGVGVVGLGVAALVLFGLARGRRRR
ncbi:hypothetical protein [Micromonospora halophytica]|uniref:Esterase-like activity of phytase family protein n=1 Tax=Micromonospora halophytica TaxID=47864 RepID=A0A1C5IKY8_9ACTN|nr:hypothetical protein [Micromonospora halophytica]SCG58466.1 hypothetical protein GA0070560_11259 [Micromonospora halophytica]